MLKSKADKLSAIEQYTSKKFDWTFIPIIFVLMIVPLVIRTVSVELNEYIRTYMPSTSLGDSFSVVRAETFIFSAVVMLFIFFSIRKEFTDNFDKRLKVYFIASGVFVLFTFISALFAMDKEFAFNGMYAQAEGFYTNACYIIAFLYTMLCFRRNYDYRYLSIPMSMVVIANFIVSISQYQGETILNNEIIMKLINPEIYWDNLANMKLSENTTMYGTMGNPNYLSTFVLLMLPFFSVLIFAEKKWLFKLYYVMISAMSVVMFFGNDSSSSYVGLACVLAMLLIVYIKQILKYWKNSIAIIILLCGGLYYADYKLENKIKNEVTGIIEDGIKILNNVPDESMDSRRIPITDLQLSGNILEIEVNDVRVNVIADGEQPLQFTTLDGTPIAYDVTDNNYTLIDVVGYEQIKFAHRTSTGDGVLDAIVVAYQNVNQVYYKIQSNGTLAFINPRTMVIVEMDYPESFGFYGYGHVGTTRGYIWSRAIPLLKDNLIIGCGPDNFVYEFPYYDKLGKFYEVISDTVLFTRPHNIFLQIGINNGGIALLAYLIIVFGYIIDSIKLYIRKKEKNFLYQIGTASLVAVVGYTAVGMFNDSWVLITPTFWIVLGFGIATNIKIKLEEKKELELIAEVEQDEPIPEPIAEEKEIVEEKKTVAEEKEPVAPIVEEKPKVNQEITDDDIMAMMNEGFTEVDKDET